MKPLLSVGIIFRNDLRCLERCLQSLEALRTEIPCQVVMADTGSDDGSREIAERYADTLFEFPWIDDFSAARNAVMDRCTGKWYLSIDADEWLDKEIRPLVEFLQDEKNRHSAAGLTIRNYASMTQKWFYSDFLAVRLLRMSTGLRYEGAIHEFWKLPENSKLAAYPLKEMLLHHDGYVCLNDGSAEGREKLRRNMRLLEKELEAAPENMELLLQCVESCSRDYQKALPYIRRGVALICEKRGEWNYYGANFLRHAVQAAHSLNLPEFAEWTALADDLFPTSSFTTVEVQFIAAQHAWNDMDYPEVILRGQRYIEGARTYRAGQRNADELLQSPLTNALFHNETSLRAYVARAQVYVGRPEAALETLGNLDYDTMDGEQVGILLETLLRLHELSRVDTAPLLQTFWSEINAPKPSQEIADQRRIQFIRSAATRFMPDCLEEERSRIEQAGLVIDPMTMERSREWGVISGLKAYRYGYTLFKPLLGAVEVGTAAVLMDEEDPKVAAQLLAGVKRFEELPIQALSRALTRGRMFPLPERPLKIEEMDSLAVRLTQDKKALLAIIKAAVTEEFAGSWQTLSWARGLVLAAVRVWDWKENGSLELAQAFVKVEKAFLSGYYAPEMLREGNLGMLPPMHRFGWYCVQAFDNLEAGDAIQAVHYLREGLSSCEEAKDVVEFLLANVPELQTPSPSPELLEMVEKVRTILAMYPADDPAVVALKASPAYQKVAHLIEE